MALCFCDLLAELKGVKISLHPLQAPFNIACFLFLFNKSLANSSSESTSVMLNDIYSSSANFPIKGVVEDEHFPFAIFIF